MSFPNICRELLSSSIHNLVRKTGEGGSDNHLDLLADIKRNDGRKDRSQDGDSLFLTHPILLL